MRNIVSYILILTICSFVIWFTIASGTPLESPAAMANILKPQTIQAAAITNTLPNNLRGPLGILLTQIVVIVLAARMLRLICSRLRQPQVIGEMAGMSLVSPATMRFLFPTSSTDTLQMFSHVGVILFMFLVGMDVDIQYLFKHAHRAVLVSHASIILPFTLGTTLSLFIYHSMAAPSASFTAFALFTGVAMSITAFPVLARIVHERGLTQCHLGIVSLGCAAVDDISAWCILAVVLSIVKPLGSQGPL